MVNRRTFLKNTAVLGAAAGTASLSTLSRTFGQQHPVSKFHAPSPLMVGLNAFSFARMLNAVAKGRKGPGMSLFQLLDYCADPQHRFDAVDMTGYYFQNYSSTEATVPADKFVDDVKRRAAELDLPICGTGIGNSFTGIPFDREGKKGIVFSKHEGGDRTTIAKDIERIKAWVEVAARLGAPVLRVFAGLEPSYLMTEHIAPSDPHKKEKAEKLRTWREQAFKWMVDDLSEVVEYGKRYGVIIGIQNHGDFLKTAVETIELIKAVDSQWIGVIVDTGYFLSPDPYLDIEAVLPYGVNFQIKEFVRVCPSPYMKPPLQPTDLKRLMRIIRRSGYRGLPANRDAFGREDRALRTSERCPVISQESTPSDCRDGVT